MYPRLMILDGPDAQSSGPLLWSACRRAPAWSSPGPFYCGDKERPPEGGLAVQCAGPK